MLFMRICVITYYCQSGGGPGAQLCTHLEVWVLGVGMSTPDAQTALYAEDRGFQVPMSLEHVRIVGTRFCDTVPRLVRPDPRVRQRIYISLDTFTDLEEWTTLCFTSG